MPAPSSPASTAGTAGCGTSNGIANNGAGKAVPAVRATLAGLAHRLLDDLAVRSG